MSDLLIICSVGLKKPAICYKKSLFFTLFLTVFHCFSPFYAQEQIAPIALGSVARFSRLLWTKEWNCDSLLGIKRGKAVKNCQKHGEKNEFFRANHSLQKNNWSHSPFTKSESLFRSFTHKKWAIRPKKPKSEFPTLLEGVGLSHLYGITSSTTDVCEYEPISNVVLRKVWES